MKPYAPLLPVGLGWLNDVGLIDQPANAVEWRRPSGLTGNDLNVTWTGLSEQTVGLGESTLDEFCRLGDASPSEVLAFVNRWGALGICRPHRLPHALVWGLCSDLTSSTGQQLYVEDGRLRQRHQWRDPIDAYRLYADQALSVIQIAHKIRKRVKHASTSLQRHASSLEGEGSADVECLAIPTDDDRRLSVPKDMWSPLSSLFTHADLGGLLDPIGDGRPASIETELALLHHAVQTWLDIGGVEVRWSWRAGRNDPEILLGSRHLFGGLALALALTTTRMAVLPVCENCHVPYTPKRKRSNNRWCEGCRPSASHRDSEARRRARRKAERSGNQ